jgi:hypothetical protein
MKWKEKQGLSAQVNSKANLVSINIFLKNSWAAIKRNTGLPWCHFLNMRFNFVYTYNFPTKIHVF